jgi:hypothetical protein
LQEENTCATFVSSKQRVFSVQNPQGNPNLYENKKDSPRSCPKVIPIYSSLEIFECFG